MGFKVYKSYSMMIEKLKTFQWPAVFAVLLVMYSVSPAISRDKAPGTFRDWSTHTSKESGNVVCTMWSKPIKAEGNYTKRGEIYVFVTHRPASKKFNELSFEAGYPFKKGSEVVVEIGGQEFKLFTKGSNAWNVTTDQDEALIKAMRAGSKMIVTGRSSRGTVTKDTYSLYGFSAGHNSVNAGCGAP